MSIIPTKRKNLNVSIKESTTVSFSHTREESCTLITHDKFQPSSDQESVLRRSKTTFKRDSSPEVRNVEDKIMNLIEKERRKTDREENMRQDIQNTNINVKRSIMNLEKLAVSDEEMIKLQRKTIYV